MRFYSIKDAPISSSDVVYRESWLNKLIPLVCAVVATGVAAWMWWNNRSWFAAIFPIAGFLFMLFMASILRHALHPSNWLARCQLDGLLIKYRSYLNEHLPEDDDVIVRIDFKELESIGKTGQWSFQPGFNSGQARSSRFVYLDLKLKSGDLSQLESKLQAERDRPATSKFIDNPVTVEQGLIRIAWKGPSARVKPAINAALAYISNTSQVGIRPEAQEKIDLVSDPKDKTQREEKLLKLIEKGDRIAAIKLARTFYGYSLSDAVKFVDDLAARP